MMSTDLSSSSSDEPHPTDVPKHAGFTGHRRIPGIATLERITRSFSPFERLLFYCFATLLIAGTALLAHAAAAPFMVATPVSGGSLTEGEVGTPRFINPLLANSDADRDLSALVYSGLMRAEPDGTLVPDLASGYTVSDDGKTYTFTLRPDATFQDGTPVTADDVVFTVNEAQDPAIKSTVEANWDGVNVSAPDARTVVFTISQPYAPFLENTTLGILPKHLWGTVTADAFPYSQLNTHPIGSGPYAVSSIVTDKTGTPSEYVLKAFPRFTLGTPYISAFLMRFYATEDDEIAAYQAGAIDSMAGITANRVDDLHIPQPQLLTVPLPRVFAVFFNQSQAPILLDASVRKALSDAIDQKAVIAAALDGYGAPLDGPIPPGVLAGGQDSVLATSTGAAARLALARSELKADGWTLASSTGFFSKKGQQLAFSLSTADTPELVASANAVVDAWKALGANVTLKVFSSGSINTNVIRPRSYDALLFGEIVGRSVDLFAFWDSTERSDPGLNLALYTNAKADTLLSEARAETDQRTRADDYVSFAKIVEADDPAVFLYAPDFIYIIPANLKGVSLGALTTPSDRFQNVYEWHLETKDVWSAFSS